MNRYIIINDWRVKNRLIASACLHTTAQNEHEALDKFSRRFSRAKLISAGLAPNTTRVLLANNQPNWQEDHCLFFAERVSDIDLDDEDGLINVKRRNRANWPSVEELKVWLGKNGFKYSVLGKELGVTGQAVIQHLKLHNLYKPITNRPNPRKSKIEWPSAEQLQTRLEEIDYNYTQLGRELGVSCQSIVKRCKMYGIHRPRPPFGIYKEQSTVAA